MPRIILECKPDETLVRTLGIPKREIIHQSSKGEVINFLRKNANCVGMVDEDPGTGVQAYQSKFKLIKNESNILYLQELEMRNRLIILKPRLEDWIVYQANSVSIKLSSFYLPENSRDLHKVINTKLDKVRDLILEMDRKNCKGIILLKDLLHR